MQIIKHNLDDILVVSIVFESQDDIESVRAYLGGNPVKISIEKSGTPTAPVTPAAYFSEHMRAILNPLSSLHPLRVKII